MNKVLVIQTFSKSFFFFYSLGWAVRHRRSLSRCATFACLGDTLLEISSFALKKRSPLRRLLWRLLGSIENFWGVDLEQVYCFANFALVILGFWAPLAFHNCWGIQFSHGIIIMFSINVKELLPSVVRGGWMIDSNPLCYARRGALNRLRFCTHSHIGILNYNWLLLKELKGYRVTFKIAFYCFWCR